MTEAAIKIMRGTTEVPFELVVVETESALAETLISGAEFLSNLGRYIHRPGRTTLVKDINAGIGAASGDFIVQAGNDIFTKPGWLEAMLECFGRFPDCGAASLAAQEVGAVLNHQPVDHITEGWYGPLMMWRRGWWLDEAYESIMSDSDLIMRLYQSGLRCYRNHGVVVLHLNNQTWNGGAGNPEYQAMTQRAYQTFVDRWGHSPLWAAQMILRGGVVFGREFER